MITCEQLPTKGQHILIMNKPKYDSKTLRTIFRRRKIATLKELKTALGTSSQATIYRKLTELRYHTSYSHGGSYYTLDEVVRFDSDGLWSFNSVWFSCHGTLLSTLEHLIEKSEEGYYSSELKEYLHHEVKTSLLNLFRQGRIERKKIQESYLYCSPKPATFQRQIANREAKRAYDGTRSIVTGKDWVSDEIKAAIIIFVSLLDEQQRRLFAGLESLQFGHGGDSWIAELLGINPHTVSKGRRQLLERDILPEGIRTKGAGRPELKKTLPK